MSKVTTVARHEFMTLITKPSFWISLIGVPIFMAVVMAVSLIGGTAATAATVASKQNQSVVQGYVDHSGLIKSIPAGNSLRAYPDEAEAKDALSQGAISGYFVIPQNYVASGDVTYVSEEINPFSSPTGAFDSVLKMNLTGGDPEALTRAQTQIVIQQEHALAPVESKGGAGLPFPLLPMFAGIMFMVLMLTASSYLMQTVSTEKENRVMEVLMSSVTPTQLLAGKIIGLGMVGLLQVALWLLSSLSALSFIPAAAGLGTVSLGSVVIAVIYFILGYFIYASLMAGLGALMPGTREAAQYTFFIILPLLIPMWLITTLVMEPNGLVSLILSLFPLSAPVVMVMRVTATDVPLVELLIGLALMVVTVFVVINLAARLFRAQSLLSGTKPSLREIVQALR